MASLRRWVGEANAEWQQRAFRNVLHRSRVIFYRRINIEIKCIYFLRQERDIKTSARWVLGEGRLRSCLLWDYRHLWITRVSENSNKTIRLQVFGCKLKLGKSLTQFCWSCFCDEKLDARSKVKSWWDDFAVGFKVSTNQTLIIIASNESFSRSCKTCRKHEHFFLVNNLQAQLDRSKSLFSINQVEDIAEKFFSEIHFPLEACTFRCWRKAWKHLWLKFFYILRHFPALFVDFIDNVSETRGAILLRRHCVGGWSSQGELLTKVFKPFPSHQPLSPPLSPRLHPLFNYIKFPLISKSVFPFAFQWGLA